jgi:hypothetical protein
MKDAAVLIEKLTGSRWESGVSGALICPDISKYFAVNMRREESAGGKLCRIHFDANLQTMGKPMDSAELARLRQEADVTYALVKVLESCDYSLTPEEMNEFNNFIYEMEQSRQQEQADGPAPGHRLI